MNEHELESTLQQALRFDFSADAKAFSNALLSRCLAELDEAKCAHPSVNATPEEPGAISSAPAQNVTFNDNDE